MAEETPIRLFSVDVNIVGTAYIFATSEDAARQLIESDLTNVGEELREGGIVDGAPYETIATSMKVHGETARVTLSPAITLVGPVENIASPLEEVEL